MPGSEQAAAALGMLASVSDAFPNISFMGRFLFEGSIVGLVVSLAITAVIVVLAMNVILVDRMLLRDSGKLRLNWDSETEFSRKLGMINIIAIVFGVVMLVVFMIAMLILPGITDPGFMSFTLILAIVIALVVLVAALLVDRSAIRKAAENLAAHEA